jgi:hypothetical protein
VGRSRSGWGEITVLETLALNHRLIDLFGGLAMGR